MIRRRTKNTSCATHPSLKATVGNPWSEGAHQSPQRAPNSGHVIFEFDDFEKAKALYNDPEYQKVAQIRRDTAKSMIVLVEGV